MITAAPRFCLFFAFLTLLPAQQLRVSSTGSSATKCPHRPFFSISTTLARLHLQAHSSLALQVKTKASSAANAPAPSKREARADDALAKLKKRARLEERLLAEPAVKQKKSNGTLSSGNVEEENGGDGDGDVVMSGTLQAAKVREGTLARPLHATRSSSAHFLCHSTRHYQPLA
jgi:hypothetical protein